MPTTPSRLSDHDPVVVYFTFPADVIAPVLGDVPADQVVEATGPAGAAVTFNTPTATDNLDLYLNVVCSPASGSTFPLGNSGVTCTSQDEAGNVGSASFTVTVQDTTAPVLTVPAGMVQEALSAAGRAVSFSVSATDAVTPSPTVTCLPASGSVFALGATAVQCTALDGSGNSSSASFNVTVRDTTAPVLTLPGHLTVNASSSAGAVITFSAAAADAVTPSPAVNCTPASGSTFAVGDTVVTCTAADAAGNVATGSFTATVAPFASAPTPGQMAGAGEVRSGDERAVFAFTVRESVRRGERGVVMVQFIDRRGQKARYLASATEVQFSDASGVSPGRRPRSGVDSVVFSGVGSWNGAEGYRFTISASDRGEPGRGKDTFDVKVYGPRGNLLKSVQGVLVDGNIQSMR